MSEIEGGEAATAGVFKQVKEVDDEINLEDPRDYMVEPLRDEFCFEETYYGAKYRLVVPVDFSNQKLVPSEPEHPQKRFEEEVDEKLCWCDIVIPSRLELTRRMPSSSKTAIQGHVRSRQ